MHEDLATFPPEEISCARAVLEARLQLLAMAATTVFACGEAAQVLTDGLGACDLLDPGHIVRLHSSRMMTRLHAESTFFVEGLWGALFHNSARQPAGLSEEALVLEFRTSLAFHDAANGNSDKYVRRLIRHALCLEETPVSACQLAKLERLKGHPGVTAWQASKAARDRRKEENRERLQGEAPQPRSSSKKRKAAAQPRKKSKQRRRVAGSAGQQAPAAEVTEGEEAADYFNGEGDPEKIYSRVHLGACVDFISSCNLFAEFPSLPMASSALASAPAEADEEGTQAEGTAGFMPGGSEASLSERLEAIKKDTRASISAGLPCSSLKPRFVSFHTQACWYIVLRPVLEQLAYESGEVAGDDVEAEAQVQAKMWAKNVLETVSPTAADAKAAIFAHFFDVSHIGGLVGNRRTGDEFKFDFSWSSDGVSTVWRFRRPRQGIGTAKGDKLRRGLDGKAPPGLGEWASELSQRDKERINIAEDTRRLFTFANCDLYELAGARKSGNCLFEWMIGPDRQQQFEDIEFFVQDPGLGIVCLCVCV